MPTEEKPPASVWTRPRRPQREQLTREQIVAAAIELLDRDGTEALSMRKLGSHLNAAATSLYRHVANRDELIQLVVDEVHGELDLPATADRGRWRAAITRLAADLRTMTLRHPWIAPELGQVGLVHIGPNALRMSRAMLAQFEAAGFTADERGRAAGTLAAYVIGIATSEAAYLSLIARSGTSEEEWVAALRPAHDAAAGQRPREAGSAGRDAHPRQLRDDDFAYGLERVLDGLAARLDT
ncbi:TetR/AcrR family transcriptional regulator C-terminal domain-containing protein [Streptomyces subrutilus]|uniref:TetR/AcrR family transcriptional regulator C-terminal domain-containing protein n=1 Tax=Streptomyces subrutilus TaxID=36818 RepID=UPI003402EC1F